MAASSMKDIKIRIKSVQSTMQITKAMELVATSKLRRAKERAEQTRPYFTALHATLSEISSVTRELDSDYVKVRDVKKNCYVIIAGDRGLAGGYNTNLFKSVLNHEQDTPFCAVPIGKKAVEWCARNGVEILSNKYALAENITISDSFEISQLLCKAFCKGQFDVLYVAYTNFVSMLSQQPAVLKILPLNYRPDLAKDEAHSLVMYEPSNAEVYNAIVPQYVGGVVYGALAESVASELGARRTAMNSATKNAGTMIDDLSLKYNRARQGAITQEITEIVAGAEA